MVKGVAKGQGGEEGRQEGDDTGREDHEERGCSATHCRGVS